MKRFLQFVIVFGYMQLLMAEEVKLPYGIILEKYTQENKDLSHNERYTISQKGKIVDVIEGHYIYDIYDGDMDKDGVRDLIFKTFSGGAHCCFDLYIAQITEDMQKPMKIPLKNLDTIEFKDLDGDGKKEWLMYDDRYSYFLTCFTCSPAVKIVTTFKKGKLILRPKLIKKFTADRLEKLTPSHVFLDSRGFLQVSQENAPAVINRFLYHFYSGDTDQSLRVIDQYFIFEGRGVKLLFIKELLERMSTSYFWDQLRKINHLYDSGMGSSIELHDTESIAINFFEKMETIKLNEWIDPSKKICIKHGGAYDEKNRVCNTLEEKIKAICDDVGGRVPTFDDYERLVKKCGSTLQYFDASKEMIEVLKKTKDKQSYHACYQKKGFMSGYSYWTSTSHALNDQSLIYVHLDEGTYDWYDGWCRVVRCVK